MSRVDTTQDRRRRRVVFVLIAVLVAGAAVVELEDRRGVDRPADVVELDDVDNQADAAEAPASAPVASERAQPESGPATTTDAVVEPLDCGGSPADAAVDATTQQVAITEIHYHPESGPEFVEVSNYGSNEVDLSGWGIAGVGYCWAAGSVLASGERLVVAEDLFEGRLDNAGERIALVGADASIVDEVEFDDRGVWPALADGHGDALHRIDPRSPGTSPGNWIAAPPAPGLPTPHRFGVLPIWTDVEHTVLPQPGATIGVTANVEGVDAVQVELAFRIGFGAEQRTEASVDRSGRVSASIPGQEAGALVRYRLIATAPDGAVGTWPRQGDGATYVGTTVATERTDLQRIDWFIEDAEFLRAFNDISIRDAASYPAVFAVDGVVFDNATIRVKGRSSRGFPKPKWKVDLPAGHRLSIEGLIEQPVDEFALHASYNDKSFLREVLAHEAFATAGLPVTEAFPVELRRNGDFEGLYIYVEQPDARWRQRVGLDESVVYEVGAEANALLSTTEAAMSPGEFELRYQREAGADDDALRALLVGLAEIQVADVDPADRRAWYYANVDVPSVLNTLAVSALVQHQDVRGKNYRLALTDGRWAMIPYDLELTWGRRFDPDCFSLCDDVGVSGPFVLADSPLTAPFETDPVFAEMLRYRISTLRSALLDPTAIRERVDAFVSLTDDVAELDRAMWGTYGEAQSPDDAAAELIEDFVVPQFERLGEAEAPFGLGSVVASDADPPVETSVVGEVWSVTNVGETTVDVSSIELSNDVTMPPGVVLISSMTVEIADGAVVSWAEG